jgi:hypothetical protein
MEKALTYFYVKKNQPRMINISTWPHKLLGFYGNREMLTHWLPYQAFCQYDKTSATSNLKEGEIYMDSWFQRFQSMVTCLCVFGLLSWQRLLPCWCLGSRERKRISTQVGFLLFSLFIPFRPPAYMVVQPTVKIGPFLLS